MKQQSFFDLLSDELKFDLNDEEINAKNLFENEDNISEKTIVSSKKPIYLKTQNDFLQEKFNQLSEKQIIEWNKDKIKLSNNGIIKTSISEHLMEILNAIEAGFEIDESVLSDYNFLKVLFKEELGL